MTTATPPVRIAVPGRTLLLVAGMPGAGKSTLLASLPAVDGLAVLDSETQRAALRPLARGVPYSWQRPLVHALHRAAVVAAAVSATPTVVVHLPATQPGTRAVVARLAAVTRREAHLLWLQADAEEALRGQYARGRVVSESSFCAHARRAAHTAAELLGDPPPGWRSVTVLDRAAARGGLRLDTDPTVAVPAAPPGAAPDAHGVEVTPGSRLTPRAHRRGVRRQSVRPSLSRVPTAATLAALQRLAARK